MIGPYGRAHESSFDPSRQNRPTAGDQVPQMTLLYLSRGFTK